MIVIYELLTVGDRTLVFGMDPTLTLCPVCRERISDDYLVVAIYAELGRLTHARCLPVNVYEQELLGHPTEVQHPSKER